MKIFSKILLLAFCFAMLAQPALASESLYNRDYVRGFISVKGGMRFMKSDGTKYINAVTGCTDKNGYSKDFAELNAEIGAEYHRLRTWFDINFMPWTPERNDTEYFIYGLTWMWGYKWFQTSSASFSMVTSAGPGIELLNIRTGASESLQSSLGPTLNVELLELRVQGSQLSASLYGGLKVVRHEPEDWSRDVNMDKMYAGFKLSWTMLSTFQKREKEME